MADTSEALKIWQALQPMIDKEIAEQTESCVRAKKMIVKRATQENESGKGVNIGVMEPYGDKVIIPSGTQLSNVNPGEPVWVYWYLNNASTMHVALTGDGSQGTADTDRLAEMLEKEIADREAALDGLKEEITKENEKIYSYIDKTSSHLRLEFTEELNGLRSYLEMTASHLRIEFQDDLNSMRSYLEMTASYLRIAFEDGLNSMRSYLELTASHLRLEFFNDMESLRSYLELTASHLRVEFADDINSLRSYLELTASALRIAFENDVESLRSYLELTASHLRLEFDNDMESLRSYLEMTASQLRIAFDNDMDSLRSYVDIQAGKIEMNVAATDENSSILRQAGMYINDQGVLVYATDNQNNIGSKLNVLSNEISAKVGKSEVVITDDSITIGSQSISLEGYVTVDELEANYLTADQIKSGVAFTGSISGTSASFTSLESSSLTVGGSSVSAHTIRIPSVASATYLGAEDLNLGHYHSITAVASGGVVTLTLGAAQASPGTDFFNIADTQFYQDGVAAAAATVDFSSESLWSGGDKTLTLTNGKTHTVSIPNASSWSSTQIGNTSYAVTAQVGGKPLNTTIDTTGSYNAGYNAGSSASTQRTATSAGTVTLSSSDTGSSISKTTTVSYDNSTSTASVPITISGANLVYSKGYSDGASSVAQRSVSSLSQITLTSSNTGTSLKATDVTYTDGSTGMAYVNVDASNVYAAGQASASLRTAEAITAGSGLTIDDTGKILSGSGTVWYDNGTYTTGVSLQVNATAAYNAGWVAGYNAAVGVSGKSGDTITIPTTTDAVNSTPTTTYTANVRVNDTHYISFPASIALVPGQTFTGAAGNYVYKNSVTLEGTSVGAVYWT